jgi:hypothetical protein
MHFEKLVLLLNKDHQANDQLKRDYIASVWAKNSTEDGHKYVERFGAYFAVHIGCRTFQMALPDSSTMYLSEKNSPKTQMIPHCEDTRNKFFSDSQKGKETWYNLRSCYMREQRKSEEKKFRVWGYGLIYFNFLILFAA